MKTVTARYFVTCLTSPDTFELTNDIFSQHDTIEWLQMNVPSPEGLGSGKDYKFSKMQNNLWASVLKTHFVFDRDFMKIVFQEINESDPDAKAVFSRLSLIKCTLNLTA